MAGEQDANEGGAATAGLTRSQVAERLGVAVATVRRLEGKRLHPRRVDGVWLFDPLEVAEVANERGTVVGQAKPSSAGALAAAVFKLLDLGRTFREIVQLTESPPDVVRELHHEWRCGFNVPPEDDRDLEQARDRDEREIRAWEQQMVDLSRREDEYELRRRLAPTPLGARLRARRTTIGDIRRGSNG